MKHESKSAIIRTRTILFLATFLMLTTACADVRGPMWLTGEPDESIFAAPRVVGTPRGASSQTWPNLSEVPDTKPKISEASVRAEKTRDLKSDNLKAQAEMERIRNIQPDGENSTGTMSTTPEEAFSFSALKP